MRRTPYYNVEQAFCCIVL